MNRIKKLCVLLLALCLLVPCVAMAVSAAATLTTVLYFEPQSPVVGEEVIVKVQFKAKSIGAVEATLTYDNALLEFLPDRSSGASGGSGTVSVAAVADKSGRSSVTVEVVFRAVKTGTSRILVALDEAYTFDKKAISSCEGARANMTIKAGSGNVTAITTQKPTTQKPTTTATTTVGGTTAPGTQPGTDELPETQPVTFAPELPAVDGYTLFTPDDTVALPEAEVFTKIALTYGGEVFDAWYSPAMSQDILLVCAAKGDGQPAWYLLNLSLSTFTLYDAVSTKPTTLPTTATTASTTARPTAPDSNVDTTVGEASQLAVLRVLVIALAAAVVVLLIIVIVLARALSANKNARH
jgi:hypothetical protein